MSSDSDSDYRPKPKKKVSKPLPNLPRKILPLKNVDKTNHESWEKNIVDGDIGNFPCPSRICIIGSCGTGKSTVAKQILLHARPLYDKVYLIHPDAEISREWSDIEPTDILDTVPPLSYFNFKSIEDLKADGEEDEKRLVIIDDLECSAANRELLYNIGLLFRYGSTHRNMSIIFAHQSWFDVPPLIKKMSNVYIIYRPRSKTELSMIENRVGLDKGELDELFNTIATGPRDSICVDLTHNTPAPLRLNVFKRIGVSE